MARAQTNCLLMARNAGSDHRRAADQRNRTTCEGHRGVRSLTAAPNLIDFERKNLWFDPIVNQRPDILVYDRDYNLKFALDGVQPDLMRPADKGYLFPWRAGQVIDQDPLNARCHVGVDLQPDDIIFGFYYYAERDFLYQGVDVNPFSNPEVRDRVVRFFYKAGHPTRTIYHELINADGSLHSTSDPDPESGQRHDIGQLAVGFSVGEMRSARKTSGCAAAGWPPNITASPRLCICGISGTGTANPIRWAARP
jgi:hypothetical protein